jgi:hypothetical protein
MKSKSDDIRISLNQNDYVYGQVNKRIWRMPWQLEAMKDVGACDKLWEGGNQPVIQRSLNGETHLA